jgi:hypothetical protein
MKINYVPLCTLYADCSRIQHIQHREPIDFMGAYVLYWRWRIRASCLTLWKSPT